MERREKKPQEFGICHRLFNFIVETLFLRGLKRVTLGKPIDRCSPQGVVDPRYRAVSGAENPGQENGVCQMVNGLSTNNVADSLVKVEFDRANGFSVVDRGSSPLRAISVEGYTEDSQVGIRKDRGKEVMVPSETGSQIRGRRNGAMKEQLKLGMESEKDVKVRAQTPMMPIISAAFNIDERSGELIRRTREALRNSSMLEA